MISLVQCAISIVIAGEVHLSGKTTLQHPEVQFKSLSGFSMESSAVYPSEGPGVIRYLLRKESSNWKVVFGRLQKELPNAQRIRLGKENAEILVLTEGAFKISLLVGAGRRAAETTDNTMVGSSSDLTKVLMTIRVYTKQQPSSH